MRQPLYIITGPTASGKSTLGLMLAQALQGAVLCADSRQIYKAFDIGTATPTAEEQAMVPHFLFNLVEATETFTVASYVEALETQIQACWEKNMPPVIVGGTGLYINSFLYQYTLPQVPPQPELRAQLSADEKAQKGILHQRVAQVDPAAAERIHPNDEFRLVRALEVFEVTGQPISQRQSRSYDLKYPQARYLALKTDKEVLYQRIQTRIDQMVEMGLIDEVKHLMQTYGPDLPLLKTLNYTEIIDYLQGKITLEEAKEQMFISTRQYAKRQRTWFKKDPHVQWCTLSEAQSLCESWLEQEESMV